jgi:hypothetical protein
MGADFNIARLILLGRAAATSIEASANRPYLRLFLASFSILFLELALIRWIPAYLRLFGYFTNFVLLASLLGCGLGILTFKASRLRIPEFSILSLALVGFVIANRFRLDIPTTEVLFYGAGETAAAGESYWVVPIMLGLIALVFVPLGKELGRRLSELPPLRAYAIDIFGSLAGIASFALLAYLSLPPVVWFGLLFCAAWPLIVGRRKAVSAAALGMTLVIVAFFGIWRTGADIHRWLSGTEMAGTVWSPYYRIVYNPNEAGDGYSFSVNNMGHQEARPQQLKEPFYFRAYNLLGNPPFKRVLIIGAGTGSDVAIALARGAEHVDAVEIDPQLYRLGKELNPDHPYDDPRVSVFIDDGRAFLRRTNNRYDLIEFAVTDSLTLTSAHANLRLESFLLTTESMRQARAHLTDAGALVLYNYYRQDWSVRKLAGMIEAAFDSRPYVTTYGAWGRAAVFMAGPRVAGLLPSLSHPYAEHDPVTEPKPGAQLPELGEGFLSGDAGIAQATDDWPFFYMTNPGLPGIYIGAVAMVGIVALFATAGLTPVVSLRRFDWHFFFLGAAFMLLETRSLVTFALLFGTTWMVNALVFFAILSSVQLAVLISARFRLRSFTPLYVSLFLLLSINYLLPTAALLEIDSSAARYVVASVLAFAPIFVANIIFSRSFRDTDHADSAFASNLLGIMTGGLVEYVALATGYQSLLIAVALFYAVALLMARRANVLVEEIA